MIHSSVLPIKLKYSLALIYQNYIATVMLKLRTIFSLLLLAITLCKMDFTKGTFQLFKQLWCFILLLSILMHSTSVSGLSSKFKVEERINFSLSRDSQTNLACPLWFHYVPSKNICRCISFISCDGMKAYVEDMYLITVKQNQSFVSVFPSKSHVLNQRINKTKPGYRLLPENISDLNHYMCGPLNRKGYLCSDCIDGFGPSLSVIEDANYCFRCSNNWRGVMIYIILVFIPVTLFYLTILVFQIRMTSAPMPCFIMYSQLVFYSLSHPWDSSFEVIETIVFTNEGHLRLVTRLILVFYGIFNLDFMSNAVPPFCVSSNLSLYHRAILGYITAFYPLLLIVVTWICIELHDRNFTMIVFLWRPFHRCFVRLRRGWDTKNDLIDVFATFFLLSYVKIFYQTFILLSSSLVLTYSLNGNYLYSNRVCNVDNTISTTSAQYITTVSIVALIFLLFNILPVLLLILYPFGMFRKMLSKLRLDRISLMIFMKKFHCCYRDGLDGRRDARYFSGIYFFLILCSALIAGTFRHFLEFKKWFTFELTYSIMILIIALCRPYKKMYVNVCDTLLLFNLATISCILSQENIKYFVTLTQSLILFPFILLVFVICFKFMFKPCSSLLVMWLRKCYRSRNSSPNSYHNDAKIVQSLNSYGTIN